MEKYIKAEAEVRYWEDAYVNGVEDEDGSLIPLREGNLWVPIIDLETGEVIGWPKGTTADIHYKVCDQGEYFFLDENFKKIAKYDSDYVPDRFFCFGEDRGYGDYMIMKINENGFIEDFKQGFIEKDQWDYL